MTEIAQDGLDQSRRSFLKLGLFGTAVLATAGVAASLSQCSTSGPASGLAVLRESDLPFLRAVIPVILAEAAAAERMPAVVQATIESLDYTLDHFSPAQRDLTLQLFDVLALSLLRGPLTGVWNRWENAGSDAIRAFLQRWQHSSISLLRMGHASLLQLIAVAWYGSPQSWAEAGYPGPPRI
jgi:hypothetical protein